MASPIQDSPGLDNKNGGLEIAAKAARRGDLGAVFDFDIAEDLPVNFNIAHFDVGMNDSVFADDQLIAARD